MFTRDLTASFCHSLIISHFLKVSGHDYTPYKGMNMYCASAFLTSFSEEGGDLKLM